MSDLGNRAIMAANIQRLMDQKGKTRIEMCEDLGLKYTTFTDWVNGKTYPRIDKIELMAKYFGVSKSELVEQPTSTTHLKELRESLGMTQEEFGKSIGIAKSTYSNYEKGIREPKSDFWVTVAQKYDVTIDYLMGYSDDPHGTVAGTSRAHTLIGRRLAEISKENATPPAPFVEGDTFLGGHMTVASIHTSEDGGVSVDFEIDGTGLSAKQLENVLNVLNGVEKETGLPIEYLSEVVSLFGKMAKGIARVPAMDNSESPPEEK